jgi:outer membrane autotransporter protein
VAPQVPSYLTAPTALFNAAFQNLDSLHRRLGEIRDDQIQGRAPQGEVFIRAFGGRFNYTSDRSFSDFGFNSAQDYAATQFGGNWSTLDDASGTLRVGMAGTLGRLWYQPSAVDGSSKGLFNTETLAGTLTWQALAGWYVDAIISGGLFDGRVTTAARGQTTGFNGTSVATSIEGGYPFPLGGGFAIEPQLQFVYEHLNFARRTDIDGIGVDLGSPNQGIFRGGARLTKLLETSNGSLVTPYLKANVLQGIGGGDSVRLSGVAFGTGAYGTALQVGSGVTGTLTRNLSVYGDIAWQHDVGGAGFRGWAFNGGLRYAFGVAPAAIVAPPTSPPALARSYLIFFDWDKADLTDRARQIVAEAAAASTRVTLTQISVSGHTDTSGTPRYNQGLSLRRAEVVAAELVREGVPRNVISIRGLGQTQLLVPTGPGVREPRNRRVEIMIR